MLAQPGAGGRSARFASADRARLRVPASTANDPSVRAATQPAFGEDTQRGYDQTAFFGSVDFDIIPNVLTVTGRHALVPIPGI